MARATFTNEQLCQAWVKQIQAKPQGTRGDVVRDLMVQMGMNHGDETERRKVYNNVTQRVKQLGKHKTKPVSFPELAQGQKGARRTDTQMDSYQAILNGSPDAE